MNSLEDIRRSVWLEITHWYGQRGDTCERPRLWFHPTTHECDGGIMASVDAPSANQPWQLIVDRTFRGFSADEFVQLLTVDGILDRLPVLANR